MLNSPRIRSVTAVLHRDGQQLEREDLLAVEFSEQQERLLPGAHEDEA